MSDPYIGHIRVVPFNFAPSGWMFCEGQLLSPLAYPVLFTLIGTTYGGDGITTFALPDLRGRVPAHPNNALTLNKQAGLEAVALHRSETEHAHTVMGNSGEASTEVPLGNQLGKGAVEAYTSGAVNTLMLGDLVEPSGGGQPHPNMQPYLVLNFIICVEYLFPPTQTA